MPLDRRTLLGAGAALGFAPALARAAGAPAETFAIWPGKAPGGERVTVTEREIPRSAEGPKDDTAFVNVTRPTLTFRAPERPNGAALLLVPGGGYQRVAIGHGGRALLDHFAGQGFAAFLLKYRLPADGWAAGPDVSLQDAQRALRLIRSRAGRHGYDPARIGVMGFSAGGHVAAMLATRGDEQTYKPVDAADRQPLGLKVAGLLYPVITMEPPFAHGGSRNNLIGRNPMPEQVRALSAERHVSKGTPPTFLAHAIDDRVVPVDNSLAMLAALRANGIPAEAHLLETGGHGFGIRDGSGAPMAWPDLFTRWAKRHGL